MSKDNLLNLLANGETDTIIKELESDGIEVFERDFYFVLEDIVEKYFKLCD